MDRQRVAFLVILATASVGLTAATQQTEVRRKSASGSDCSCPKEGGWNVQNLEGWMNCTGPVNRKRKLKKAKDRGTIWVLKKDCSSLFGETSEKNDEDVLMNRVEG